MQKITFQQCIPFGSVPRFTCSSNLHKVHNKQGPCPPAIDLWVSMGCRVFQFKPIYFTSQHCCFFTWKCVCVYMCVYRLLQVFKALQHWVLIRKTHHTVTALKAWETFGRTGLLGHSFYSEAFYFQSDIPMLTSLRNKSHPLITPCIDPRSQ